MEDGIIKGVILILLGIMGLIDIRILFGMFIGLGIGLIIIEFAEYFEKRSKKNG